MYGARHGAVSMTASFANVVGKWDPRRVDLWKESGIFLSHAPGQSTPRREWRLTGAHFWGSNDRSWPISDGCSSRNLPFRPKSPESSASVTHRPQQSEESGR